MEDPSSYILVGPSFLIFFSDGFFFGGDQQNGVANRRPGAMFESKGDHGLSMHRT